MFPRSAKSQSLLTPVVKKLICDTTSFESICQSNHNLHTIGEQTDYLMCGGRGGVEGDMSEKDYQDLRDAFFNQDDYTLQNLLLGRACQNGWVA